MKIAVIEHFTSLPPGAAPADLVAQGRAMLEACAADLREIPQKVRDELEIVLVKKMDEVLAAALDHPQPALRVAA